MGRDTRGEWHNATEAVRVVKSGYFLCSLLSLRSYIRAKTRAMNPITAIVVNAMSMFDIILNLHSINNKSCDKEENDPDKSYPQCMLRELISNKVSYYSKTHYKLAYIIAILREVVYLLLFQHGYIKKAMDVPYCEAGETCWKISFC